MKPAELLMAREILARAALPPEQREVMLRDTEDRRVALLPSGARIDWKQGDYILNKWTSKGWWEYGVTSRAGWVTPEGKVALETAIAGSNQHTIDTQTSQVPIKTPEQRATSGI